MQGQPLCTAETRSSRSRLEIQSDIDDCDSDTKEAILLYHICIIMPESTLAMIERTDAHFVGVGLFCSKKMP